MPKKKKWEPRKGFVNVQLTSMGEDGEISTYKLVKIEEYLEDAYWWCYPFTSNVNDEIRADFIAMLYKSGETSFFDDIDRHKFLISDIKKYAKKYIKIYPEKFVV